LRILFARNLFAPEDLGGNRYPVEVTRRLAERGHAVTVITSQGDTNLRRAYPWARFLTYRRPRWNTLVNHAVHLAAAGRLFRRALRRRGAFDVILTGSYEVAAAGLACGRLRQTPLVFTYHSELRSDYLSRLAAASSPGERLLSWAFSAYSRRLERWVLEAPARVVAVSEFSAQQIRERAPRAAGRVEMISTAVDVAFFSPAEDRAAVKRSLGIDEHVPLVIGVGRLNPVKQFHLFLDMVAKLAERGLEVEAALIGDGSERATLERQASALGLRRPVRFTGQLRAEELRQYMRAADLQVCSSEFENRSLAMLEAFACGAPVVGTPTGGTPELLRLVDDALIARESSAEALANAAQPLLRDAPRRSRLGEECRQTVVRQFGWDATVDALERLLEQVKQPS
jgi:glycosyltransferase involved in cell wall biosynthesis